MRQLINEIITKVTAANIAVHSKKRAAQSPKLEQAAALLNEVTMDLEALKIMAPEEPRTIEDEIHG